MPSTSTEALRHLKRMRGGLTISTRTKYLVGKPTNGYREGWKRHCYDLLDELRAIDGVYGLPYMNLIIYLSMKHFALRLTVEPMCKLSSIVLPIEIIIQEVGI